MTDADASPARMIRAIYVSRPADGLTSDDLRAIGETSRRSNQKLGLSGLLLYVGDNDAQHAFIQTLEGPETNVLATLEAIDRDDRHDQMKIVLDQVIAEPRFPGWSMATFEIDARALPRTLIETLAQIGALPAEARHALGRETLAERVSRSDPAALLAFLERFYLIQTHSTRID